MVHNGTQVCCRCVKLVQTFKIEQMLKLIRNLFKGRKQQCNIPVVIGRFGYTEIETAQNKIKEVRKMYNQHLHGWQYEAQINYTANKMQEILDIFTSCKCDECKTVLHKSDCAVHNEPAYKNDKCNCGVVNAL